MYDGKDIRSDRLTDRKQEHIERWQGFPRHQDFSMPTT
jgi:hypothetical protein